jgi:hypothetical protein
MLLALLGLPDFFNVSLRDYDFGDMNMHTLGKLFLARTTLLCLFLEVRNETRLAN